MAYDGSELRLDWDGIPVAAMDCATDNLAVLLRHHGAGDVLSPFGCEWHLGAGTDGALVLDRLPADDLVPRLTGFALRPQVPAPDALLGTIADRVAAGQPVLVYADAYFLPWLPYFGTARMDHTFLVTGRSADGRTWAVTDAYDNPTQWGHATPVRTYVDGFGLARAVAALDSPYAGRIVTVERVAEPAAPDWLPLLAENAATVAAATQAGVLSAYADQFRERLDDPAAVAELTLGCWLVQRRRALHAAWLADLAARRPELLPAGFADDFAADVAGGWRRARDFAYIAQRRAEQGRRAPATTLDLLATTVEPAEAAAAKRLAEHVGSLA